MSIAGQLSDEIKVQLVRKKEHLPLVTLPENLLTALLDLFRHGNDEIYYNRYRFIRFLIQRPIECQIFYSIATRLRHLQNLSLEAVRSKLGDVADQCLNTDFIPICSEARLMLYFDMLCTIDTDPVLQMPFTDNGELRQYKLSKIYHLFDRALKQYPEYYKAYNGKGKPPQDYAKKVKAIYSDILSEMSDELSESDKLTYAIQ